MSKAFETKIYVFDTSVLQDESLFKKFYRTVPSFRQKKVDFYKDYKDKCLSLGVGLVLIKALKSAGYDIKNLEWAYYENGRPYFKGNEEIQFALSHSHERALCAISVNRIGCDVEFVTPDNETEIEQWTKIESYAKATDLELAYLLSGKTAPDSKFHFKQLELKDGYIYTVCSEEEINDNQVQVLKIEDFD
ncbi:MAG: hypothetical protein SPI86_09015 [Treponemataceae bacterium]|nr:hypothetical protein [Spirochaetales bacterium]MDY6031882.1 hypothetical protein [Treponemataceae bacterium]